MRTIAIHRQLHDVFGERQTVPGIAVTLLFGLGVPALLAVTEADMLGALPLWRSAIALLLVLDIAAGSLANFTRSTNDFYAARPRNRWAFIAIHVHVVAVAWLVGSDLAAAIAIWAYTIASAITVNLLKGSPLQTLAGGTLLATGLCWLPLWPGLSPFMAATGALFMLKVIFSFAVDHYGRDRA
ncbi:hypothetical protein [Aminobacter aminovorans]|uniref:hypothetical protein n=1 Tax=Aminobacter aminovorans TaxID=83263 RepID=UPI002861C3EB|nr:hypothetical protein [Aminobacter aminovorans]MDR7220997.1 hypothetical protein [Aminobacter aminovorans]